MSTETNGNARWCWRTERKSAHLTKEALSAEGTAQEKLWRPLRIIADFPAHMMEVQALIDLQTNAIVGRGRMSGLLTTN